MAITAEDIRAVLFNQTEYWFSRKTDDGYKNISIDEVDDGDIIWFRSTATREDLDDAKKALKQLDLHMYSKTIDRNKEDRKNHIFNDYLCLSLAIKEIEMKSN